MSMKVRVVENAKSLTEEAEAVIYCHERTEETDSVESYIRGLGINLLGTDGEQSCRLKPGEIYYFEVVDGRTFAYLEEKVWQVGKSLETLENMFADSASLGFFRVSKACIINLHHVDYFTSTMGNRIIATMENGEQVIVSRHYARLLRAFIKAGKEQTNE